MKWEFNTQEKRFVELNHFFQWYKCTLVRKQAFSKYPNITKRSSKSILDIVIENGSLQQIALVTLSFLTQEAYTASTKLYTFSLSIFDIISESKHTSKNYLLYPNILPCKKQCIRPLLHPMKINMYQDFVVFFLIIIALEYYPSLIN